MTDLSNEDVRALARNALDDLERGSSLRTVVERAVQIADVRRHVAEGVWLRLQLIDLPEETPTRVPEDIERLWKAIDASSLIEVTRDLRIGTMQDHFDSRTPSRTPDKLFTKRIESLEEIIRKCDVLEGGPPMDAELALACADAREVYERVRARVRDYLLRHAK